MATKKGEEYVIRGAKIPEQRLCSCGCNMKIYPIGEDRDLADFLVVRKADTTDKGWTMQLHSHPDFDEYWYITKAKKGACSFIIGDEEVDAEEGDLIITPRGVPHKIKGDASVICFSCKYNVFGKTTNGKLTYVGHDTPEREDPTGLPAVGDYCEIDFNPLYKVKP